MTDNNQASSIKTQIDHAEAAGQWAVADKLYTELRKLDDSPYIQHRHAQIVVRAGDASRAATILRGALRNDPGNIEITFHLVEIYMWQKRVPQAEKLLKDILLDKPDHQGALRALSKIQHDNNDYEVAEENVRKLLSLNPDDIEGGLILGAILSNSAKRFAEAEPVFRHVLEISPDSASALHNYGLLKRFQGDLETAEKYLLRACELYPDKTDFAFSLGTCYMFMEDMEKSYHWLRRAVEIDPGNNAAQVYVAFALFLMGRIKEGWAQYEKRLGLSVFKEANYERPRWKGENLDGKTLLLISEQGMGDNIQFIRYVEQIADTGAQIIVATHGPLLELFESLKGVTRVMQAVPEPKYFYRYCPLMSLPYVCGTDETNVPGNVPYLHAPDAYIEKWAARLGEHECFRVGLCWRGNSQHTNDRFRSSSLEQMSELLDVEGVRFFCLSKGLPEHERDMPDGILGLGDEFDNFSDVAAVMEAMDLVISVDTAICHLAGAVGKPVWTMLARGPDFRWGLTGEETPWYPTMKLYRQKTLGQWDDVIGRMRADLTALAAANG